MTPPLQPRAVGLRAAAHGPFDPPSLDSVRAHPAFRDVCERLARQHADWFDSLDEANRTLNIDLGRVAIVVAMILLDASQGSVTTAGLLKATAASETASRSRTLAVIKQMLQWNLVALEGEDVAWTRRRLVLSPRLVGPLKSRVTTDGRAYLQLFPELTALIPRLDAADFYRVFMVCSAMIAQTRPDIFSGDHTPIGLFYRRDGGMRMLWEIMRQQPRERTELVESAPFEPSHLSRVAGVSRPQVYRMVADGEADGLLRREGGRILVDPKLSRDIERHQATMAILFREAMISANQALPA